MSKKILCFGDSNTWGYNPETKGRYPENVRWTGILKKNLLNDDVCVIEEGLCGRTTVFEDEIRPGRCGRDSIEKIFQKNKSINSVIIMLGTNDCKSYYKTSAKDIAKGMERCIDIILKNVSSENVLLISPIHLGKNVWKDEFDPEFNQDSVEVSKELKKEYLKIARRRKVNFLAASDYVNPSIEDQEHLNADGHRRLAEIIYRELYSFHTAVSATGATN